MRSIIINNTSYQVFNKIINSLTTIIFTALITRYMGVVTFGEYSIVISYVMTFYIITDFGINTVVCKEFSVIKSKIKDNFAKIMVLRFLVGVAIGLLSILILWVIPYPNHIKYTIVLASPIILVHSLLMANNIIFQVYSIYKYMFYASLIGNLCYVSMAFVLVNLKLANLTLVIMVYIFGLVLSLIVSLYYVKDYIKYVGKLIDFVYYKEILIKAYPIGIALLLNSLMVHVDRFVLSIMSTPISVGVYNLAYRIFELVLVLPTFVMNSSLPLLMNLRVNSRNKYFVKFKKIVLYLSIAAVLTCLLMIVINKPVISAIWGDDMKVSSIPLNILLSGLILFFITSPITWFLYIEGYQKTLPLIYFIALIVNIVLCIVYIPIYDYNAAAVITVISELLILIMLLYVLKYKRLLS